MAEERLRPLSSSGAAATTESDAASADLRKLQTELETLKAERTKWIERQRRIMELIGGVNPDHIVHDIRNVLNERNLLRALVEQMPEE